jgi:hypothetical protein
MILRLQAPVWLRIASVITALYAAGHTAGMPWTPSEDVMAQGAVVAMRGVHFEVAGVTRSYWDFYQGFGLTISVLLIVQAVLLWQLAGLARDTGRYRAMAVAHLVGFLALAGVAARYIFALPLWLSVVIAACLVVAVLRPATNTSSRSA